MWVQQNLSIFLLFIGGVFLFYWWYVTEKTEKLAAAMVQQSVRSNSTAQDSPDQSLKIPTRPLLSPLNLLLQQVENLPKITAVREKILLNQTFWRSLKNLTSLDQDLVLDQIFLGQILEKPILQNFKINVKTGQIFRKRLPNLIGIGAKKCGTGALASYLAHHSQVVSSEDGPDHLIETHFFDQKFRAEKKPKKYGKFKKSGLNVYLSQN